MDYTNIIIALCSVIGTVFSITKILGKKFEKIEENFKEIRLDIRQLDNRLSHLEGYLIGTSQKTGTESIKEKK